MTDAKDTPDARAAESRGPDLKAADLKAPDPKAADTRARATASQPERDTRMRAADAGPGDAGRAAQPNGSAAAVQPQMTQYLIAPRTLPDGVRPMSTDMIHAALTDMPDVTVVRRIKPHGMIGAFSVNDPTSTGEIIVARTTVERGRELEMAARANPLVIVEQDALLNHHGVTVAPQPTPGSLPGAFGRTQLDVQFRVVGMQGQPLRGAMIQVYGRNFPFQATTDQNGSATVTLAGESPDSLRALYVKPAADHWERWIDRPQLDPQGVNTITLRPLSETIRGFPDQQVLGWGQILMGLDRIPANLDGAGVKIGIIDSGCDNTHPLLQHVRNGVDLTNGNDPDSWAIDGESHGTHCAGIITAGSAQAQGIRGFAPAAEVHAFKVFPNGRFSSLIDALDLCIERGIDVVNCSLGSDQVSEIVQRKFEEARQKGVACVVAAGNSSGPVQFPATLPIVLSVAAIGQEKQYPADTYHAQTEMAGMVGVNGLFPAKFSCFGPQVKVCGPGVAIVSSVPGGYAAWDGTSMAAPHLTGMAALVLAHHPAFQGAMKPRTAQRVDALFQLVLSAATAVFPDPTRVGAGLPDVTRLVGAQVSAPATATSISQLAPVLGPAFGALAGVPLGPQVGALLSQLLAGHGLAGQTGAPPFMVAGPGGVLGQGAFGVGAGQGMANLGIGNLQNAPYNAQYLAGVQALMQLRSLGLA